MQMVIKFITMPATLMVIHVIMQCALQLCSLNECHVLISSIDKQFL